MVGIPTGAPSRLMMKAMNVATAPKNPRMEKKNPESRARRAGMRLVETNPLIA